MKKGTHFILENEKPLEQLWDIAKKYGAEKEVRQWMEDYVEIFKLEDSISHLSLNSVEDKDELLECHQDNSLHKLGFKTAEIAHTWCKTVELDEYYGMGGMDRREGLGDRYRYEMLAILPRKRNR